MPATNVNKVFGLKLIGTTRAGLHSARVRQYWVPSTDATAIFLGDAVKSGGTADPTTGESTITQAAAGDVLRGVAVGFNCIKGISPGNENLNRNYRPANTAMYVLVCDDPDAIYEIQENAVGGAFPLTAVGENADLVVGTGNTGTSLSGMQLNTQTHATSSLQLRVLQFVERPDNAPGVANAKLVVKINKHELLQTTGV